MIELLITYMVGVVLFLMTSLVGVLTKRRRITFRKFWPGFVIWAIIQEYDEEQDARK